MHSPIVTCALALSIMAQVSACNFVKGCSEDGDSGEGEREGYEDNGFGKKLGGRSYESGRERIRLGLGALRSQRSVWGMAGRSVREVSGVARELLGVKNAHSIHGVSSASGGSTGNSTEWYGRQEGSGGEERTSVMEGVDVDANGKTGEEESFLDLLGGQDDSLLLVDGGSNGDEGMRYIRFQDFEAASLEVSA